jgi:hypothetical protein
MITTRTKLAAGGAALVAGAGLTLVLWAGNAGATAPGHAPNTTPAGVVVTRSAVPGAVPNKVDPKAPRPTATITATPGPAVPGGPVVTKSIAPGAVASKVDPKAPRPTATITATPGPAAPGGQKAVPGGNSGVQTIIAKDGSKVTVPLEPGPPTTVYPTPVAPATR